MAYQKISFLPGEVLTATKMNLLANNGVPDGSIGTNQLAVGSVTNSAIKDGAVSRAKIGPLAVSADKIDFTTFPAFPNYSSVQTLSATAGSVVAPSHGWLIVKTILDTAKYGSSVKLKVGSQEITMLGWFANTTNYNTQGTLMIPAAKGTTITIERNNGAKTEFVKFVKA